MPVRQASQTSGHYGTFIARRSQKLQKIGSCILLLGVPISIMGIIFTMVAYGNMIKSAYMWTFSVLGPVLVSTAIVCFLVGFIMFQMTEETLARLYSYFTNTEPNTDLFCLCCDLGYFATYRRQGGDNSKRPRVNSHTSYPRSILHHSSKADHKSMANRVHFDSQSDDDVTYTERSLSNCSITSLQRHCRVHPSQISWEENAEPPLAMVSENIQDSVSLNSHSNGIHRPRSASQVRAEIDIYTPEYSSVL